MSIRKHGGAAAISSPQKYWLYGMHAVRAALSNPRRRVLRLAAAKDAAGEKLEGAWDARRHPRIETMDAAALARLLPKDAVHQGIAAEVQPLPPAALEELLGEKKRPLVLLDQVTDPHNIGAILRSCAAFEAAGLVLTEAHSPPESAAMAKAASGGLEIVPVARVSNLASAMEMIRKAGWWLTGLDGAASLAIGQAKLGLDTALVLGAEGKGLRRLTSERCDLLVRLPISARMESLNVSNAAAVALYALGAMNR